jgi:hypothetical protein
MPRLAASAALSQVGRTTATAAAVSGCALFTALLLSLFQVSGIPPLVPVALLGLAALAAWRPAMALMIVAGGVPVAAWVGRWWNESVAWPEALVVAFAVGYLARTIRWRPSQDGLTLGIAAFVTVVLTSLVVQFAVMHWILGGDALVQQLTQLVRSQYFLSSGTFPELDAAMRLVEGTVLLRAAATVTERRPSSSGLIVRWIVAGGAVAGALTLWRLWQGALRTEAPAAQFLEYLASVRYNVHYGDVNAAGSYYAMTLLLALGLIIAVRKPVWIAAALLIVPSLMLSGSRTAFLSAALAGGAWTAAALLGRHRRVRPSLAWPIMLIVLCSAGAAYYFGAGRNWTPASSALSIRAGFVQTTARMVHAYPVFGVGVGRYLTESGRYSPPGLLQQFGTLSENAHNNFLQLLGELGVVGFAVFLVVLGVAGQRALAPSDDGSRALRYGTAAGLAAFVLTWLSGHPLLIDEPAMSFWLLLGVAAGRPPDTPAVKASPGVAAFAAVLMMVLVVSVPQRIQRHVAAATPEHHAIGVSPWQQSATGVRYRVAGPVSTVFVPPAPAVTIPLRSARAGRELVVSIVLDGRKVNEVRIRNNDWFLMRLVLARQQSATPRFARVQFIVENPDPQERDLLMIGKVEPHY